MDTKTPLVSVICLCYNHSKFIGEAIRSVTNQDYPAVELIVLDDCSEDDSVEVVKKLMKEGVSVEHLIVNEKNLGMCRSFNKALRLAKGDFIIDLAGDDLLLSRRISLGVARLAEKGSQFGVHYSKALEIDEDGNIIGAPKVFDAPEKEGDLYPHLIRRFMISAPTMMTRKSVLEDMGGYDESLAYEDFDFWIRSARNYLYAYSDEVLVYKRMHTNNHSRQHTQVGNKLMMSTLRVCQKILALNERKSEHQALRSRIFYQLKVSFFTANLRAFAGFCQLLILTQIAIWKTR